MDFELSCDSPSGSHSARARDISVGGMFIETDAQLEFGLEVTISCVFPGSDARYVLPATVRWASPGGVGLQFGLLGARETHAIIRLMKA